MSTASFLNDNLGSESEDENFNPAPADDSDNEAAGDSDDELNARPNQNSADQRHRPSDDDRNGGKDHRATKDTPQRNGNKGSDGVGEDDGDNGADGLNDSDPDIGNGAGGEEEEEEDDEDDEEDEDEEEDISVCQSPVICGAVHLMRALGSATKTSSSRTQKPLSRC